jgi:hypothetical protein
MKLTVIIPTWDMERASKVRDQLESLSRWEDTDILIMLSPNMSAVDNMATGGDLPGDILMFIHDDVEVYEEGWDSKIMKFMDKHPECGMVGFGGASGLGTDDLYKTRYDYHQLARINFMSNLRDAEDHGQRITEPVPCAVLDGFCQIIRREAYNAVGGWRAIKSMGLQFHCYDTAMACMLAEKGWGVWVLPIECHHLGGRTSCSPQYDGWLRKQGIKGDKQVHEEAHKVIYNRFKAILPLKVRIH